MTQLNPSKIIVVILITYILKKNNKSSVQTLYIKASGPARPRSLRLGISPSILYFYRVKEFIEARGHVRTAGYIKEVRR